MARRPRIRLVTHTIFDTVALVGGETVHCHIPSLCKGQSCSVHNPSDHHMKSWRQHWRVDRNFMERICEHGIGHPDPDHMSFLKTQLSKESYECEGVHGCDGCCKEKIK